MTDKQIKQDAEELVQKFRLFKGASYYHTNDVTINNYNISKYNAKQCAIIHLDLVFDALFEIRKELFDNIYFTDLIDKEISDQNQLKQYIQTKM